MVGELGELLLAGTVYRTAVHVECTIFFADIIEIVTITPDRILVIATEIGDFAERSVVVEPYITSR